MATKKKATKVAKVVEVVEVVAPKLFECANLESELQKALALQIGSEKVELCEAVRGLSKASVSMLLTLGVATAYKGGCGFDCRTSASTGTKAFLGLAGHLRKVGSTDFVHAVERDGKPLASITTYCQPHHYGAFGTGKDTVSNTVKKGALPAIAWLQKADNRELLSAVVNERLSELDSERVSLSTSATIAELCAKVETAHSK